MQESEKNVFPLLVYGTAWKKEQTAEFVFKAIEAGFRGIDTACQPRHYNEKQVGEAIKKAEELGVARTSLHVQTKFTPPGGQDSGTIPYDPQAPLEEQIRESFRVSQKNLQTHYVDCLILHSPFNTFEETLRAWQVMEEIHEEGGARMLGISNCYHPLFFKELYRIATARPSVLQNRFYAETGYDKELRLFCREQGIVYESFWTLTANPHLMESQTVVSLAEKYGKTPAQILFRYLTQYGVVPLTGTRSVEHMREDLEIVGFELDAEELEIISLLL